MFDKIKKHPFENGQVPPSLVASLKDKEVVLIGETHYVQEHQVFLGHLSQDLLPFGFKVIYSELMHAYGWLVEDYVLGRISHLPDTIRYFENQIIEDLRDHNLTHHNRVFIRYVDMNHWPNNFIDSVKEMNKYLDTQNLFDRLLEVQPDTPAYQLLLLDIQDQIKTKKVVFQAPWQRRIQDLIDVEIQSYVLRIEAYDPKKREAIMKGLIQTYMEEDGKIIFNGGNNHTQKNHVLGPGHDYQVLGEWLNQSYDCFSLACFPIQGYTIDSFRQPVPKYFNICNQSDDHLFGPLTRGLHSHLYISLEDQVFDRAFKTYDRSEPMTMIPRRQFDALILYDNIHVLSSMSQFHYKDTNK